MPVFLKNNIYRIFLVTTLTVVFFVGVSGAQVISREQTIQDKIKKLEGILDNRDNFRGYLDRGNIIIYYNEKTADEAKLASNVAGKMKTDFCKLLECNVTDKKTYIYIFDEKGSWTERYQKLVNRPPSSLVAFTTYESKIDEEGLGLKDDKVRIYLYELNNNEDFENNIQHELGHALVVQWLVGVSGVKRLLPMGVEEGLVQFLGGDILEKSYSFALTLKKEGKIIPLKTMLILDELELRERGVIESNIGHIEAASLIYYILSQDGGINKFRRLAKELVLKSTDEEVYQSFQSIFGMSVEQFQQNWLKWVQSQPSVIKDYVDRAKRDLPTDTYQKLTASYRTSPIPQSPPQPSSLSPRYNR